MGTSTRGMIFFGIVFPDEFEFPWHDHEEELDFEDWYYQTTYKDKSEDELNYDFRKENPIPFELEFTQSYDYPLFALIIKDSLVESCDDCTEIDVSGLTVNPDKVIELVEFCRKYFSECDDMPELSPKWYLSGMHG